MSGILTAASVRIAATSGGGATFTDNFDRADANPISNPASDGSGTWTSGPGSFNAIQIISNAACSASGDAAGSVNSPTFSADHTATITVDASSGITGIGPLVRVASSVSGSCYLAYLSSDTSVQIYKGTDGGASVSFSAIGSAFTITSVTASDTIGLKVSGSATTTLELFRNGVSQGTRTDSSSPHTTGQPGFYSNGSTNRVRAFTATDS